MVIFFFTHASNTFVITRDVIVQARRLPEAQYEAVSYSEAEMRTFLTHVGYTGDMRRMGRLVPSYAKNGISTSTA